jgi:hypothetical protein
LLSTCSGLRTSAITASSGISVGGPANSALQALGVLVSSTGFDAADFFAVSF